MFKFIVITVSLIDLVIITVANVIFNTISTSLKTACLSKKCDKCNVSIHKQLFIIVIYYNIFLIME